MGDLSVSVGDGATWDVRSTIFVMIVQNLLSQFDTYRFYDAKQVNNL